MIRELIEEIELEKAAEAVLFEDEFEKMAEAYIDELALELANEWLEKEAVDLKGTVKLLRRGARRLTGSRGAIAQDVERASGEAIKGTSGRANPALFGRKAVRAPGPPRAPAGPRRGSRTSS